MNKCLSIHLSVCLSVYLPIYLSTYLPIYPYEPNMSMRQLAEMMTCDEERWTCLWLFFTSGNDGATIRNESSTCPSWKHKTEMGKRLVWASHISYTFCVAWKNRRAISDFFNLTCRTCPWILPQGRLSKLKTCVCAASAQLGREKSRLLKLEQKSGDPVRQSSRKLTR